MGLFSRSRTGPGKDPLEGRAHRLLAAVQEDSDALLRDLTQSHSELRWAKEADWRFYVTAAAMYVASLRLYEQVSPERHASLSEIVNAKLPMGASEAMTECSQFMTRAGQAAVEPPVFASTLGFWVLSKVFRRVPAASQAELATKIGLAVTASFGDWWDESSNRA